MKTLYLSVFALVVLISCQKSDDLVIDSSNLLIGNWINPVYNDSLLTVDRSNNLKEQAYGFSFKSENQFVERKNAGWCGTPPVTYGDFQGTWLQTDSTISITVAFWGGTMDYTWQITSISDTRLMVIQKEIVVHFEGE